jgi:hypothetical protein
MTTATLGSTDPAAPSAVAAETRGPFGSAWGLGRCRTGPGMGPMNRCGRAATAIGHRVRGRHVDVTVPSSVAAHKPMPGCM